MRTWDGINNCPSYKFTCEPNELYDDIADLLLQPQWLRSHNNKKTVNPYYFHNKSDLDTQINASDGLKNKQTISVEFSFNSSDIILRADHPLFMQKLMFESM